MDLRQLLRKEFARRRALNRSYSLRNFARSLGMHHTSLGRLLAGATAPSARTIARVGGRLGLSQEQIAACRGRENAARVAAAIASARARPDSRRIAMLAGISTDAVNVALHELLASGALRFESAHSWRMVAGTARERAS
jgi:transcriptional regulator with XRE-family HTH domain